MGDDNAWGVPPHWPRVFHPRHTAWGSHHEVWVDKVESFQVLFLNNPHFLRSGLSVVREYEAWCDTHAEGGYLLDHATKAKTFLEARVAAAQQRWIDDVQAGVAKPNTPEECAMNSFRTAICHLNALANWQGCPLDLLSEEPILVLRERLVRAQNTARAAPRDYAASSRFLTKRLTHDEMEAITHCWWDGTAAERAASTQVGRERAQVRGLLFHCLQKAIGRRGGDIRNIRNAMLFFHRLPKTRPCTSCPVIGASLRHVKEYSENVEHLLGWARSQDRLACPIGALACHFVWMNDIVGIPILEEIRRDLRCSGKEKPWWRRMLFVTDTHDDQNENPMSYATHYKAIHAGFGAIGAVGKTAATHIYRSTLACDTLESGASFLDVGVFQGWYHDNAADAYLRGAFKADSMLRACGWEDGQDSFECWWEGCDADIPDGLRFNVLPGLDELFEEATSQYEATLRDRSAVEFLKVLLFLRRVFIEDAVFKRQQYPKFPAYQRHVLFSMAEWPEYCVGEMQRIMDREERAFAVQNQEQAQLSEMIKTTVESTMRGVLTHVLQDIGVPKGASFARRHVKTDDAVPSNAPIELPKATEELPEIPEPSCLYTCYQVWQQQRAYFYSTPQPPWKKRFGDRAATMKLRYSRMRPYLTYLDRCGASARRAIDALDAFRCERKVAASVFIKQCFYHMEHGLKEDCKKPPPILPAELRSRMERDNLPAF
jgi:hypothetical protein